MTVETPSFLSSAKASGFGEEPRKKRLVTLPALCTPGMVIFSARGADFWAPAGADCATSGETRAAMGRTSAARARRRKICRGTGSLLLFHFTTAARGRRRYDARAARKKSAETTPLIIDVVRKSQLQVVFFFLDSNFADVDTAQPGSGERGSAKPAASRRYGRGF